MFCHNNQERKCDRFKCNSVLTFDHHSSSVDMNSLPETIQEAPSVETLPPTTTVSTSVKITVTAKPMCSLAGQRTSSMQSVVNGNGRVGPLQWCYFVCLYILSFNIALFPRK